MKPIALLVPLTALTVAGAALACEDKASMAGAAPAILATPAPASTGAPAQAKAATSDAKAIARVRSTPLAKTQDRTVLAGGEKSR